MNWIPAYGILIFALTIFNYLLGLGIDNFPKFSRRLLTAGLVLNLACLCFFKYTNFLLDSLIGCYAQLLAKGQIHTTQTMHMNIILPLGISFFVFEFIHYIVDVYRGSKPVRNFRDFALFAAFFPSQIAGPIKRYQDFITQLHKPLSFKQISFGAGVFLIFQGFFKKVVLGDNMGILVDYGFSHINKLGAVDAWLAVVGFTFQIFFDFSGYTDIGRGSALLFGYSVPENFNWPFLAANLTDFWRRWHMSLSTWLRDYLFIPLGGSRGSPWAVRKNIMLTMIIGGLWHGAAWHYAIWGAFHGLGLVVTKEWHDLITKIKPLARWRDDAKENPIQHWFWHHSGIVVTLLFLFVAGTLFKAKNMEDTFAMLAKLISLDPGGELTRRFWLSTVPISLFTYSGFLLVRSLNDHPIRWPTQLQNATAWGRAHAMRPYDTSTSDGTSYISTGDISNSSGMSYNFFVHILELAGSLFTSVRDWWNSSPPLRVATCLAVAIVILGFAPAKLAPFIYFQF